MEIIVNENLQLALPRGVPAVQLTPGEAFDLAEQLVRGGIRWAMLDEADKQYEARCSIKASNDE